MSEKEKENIVSLISSLLVSIPYFIYLFDKHSNSSFSGDEELKFWATAILVLIPIRIVVQIVVFIVFTIIKAIVTNNMDTKEISDERDRLIELKGDRNSTNFFIFGFIAALLCVALGGTMTLMFVILIASGFISEFIGIMSKFYFYRIGKI